MNRLPTDTGLPELDLFPEGSVWRVYSDYQDYTWIAAYVPLPWWERPFYWFRPRRVAYRRLIKGVVTPEKILDGAEDIVEAHTYYLENLDAQRKAEKYHGYYPPKSLA